MSTTTPPPQTEPDDDPGDQPQSHSMTDWDVAAIGVMVVGLIALVAIVIGKFDSSRDTVTGVLGVVVPAFATIGAAAFGIKVGYSAGSTQGEATGKAKMAEAQRAGAKKVAAHAQEAKSAFDDITQKLTTALESPAGENAYVVPGTTTPVVERGDLIKAREALERAVAPLE